MTVRIMLCLLASAGGYVFGGGGWLIGALMLLLLFLAAVDEATEASPRAPQSRSVPSNPPHCPQERRKGA